MDDRKESLPITYKTMNRFGGNFRTRLYNFHFNGRTTDILLIVSLVAANVLIKSLFITDYNIDLDEPFSVYYAQGSFRELIKIFTWENNPPLFYIILHFWIRLFGIGTLSVRFLPMLFSSLTVIFVYKTGERFINRLAAITACILYTCSNVVIMEAHDARIYSILVFLTAASMYYYFQLIQSHGNRRYITALTIVNVLLIYSHFLGFYVIATQVIFLLSFKELRLNIFRLYLISSVTLLIFYTPYLYFVVLRLSQALKTGIYTPKTELAHLVNLGWIFGNNLLISIQYLLILIAFALLIGIKHIRCTLYEKMILVWPFLCLLIVGLLSVKISILPIPKYLIFIIPGFFLAFSVSVKYFYEYSKIAGVCILVFSITLMIITTEPKSSQGFEIKKTLQAIKNQKSDSTALLIIPDYIDLVFTYHYNSNAFKDFGNHRKYLSNNKIYVIDNPEIIDEKITENASDILLLVGWRPLSDFDPENKIYTTLSKRYKHYHQLASFRGYDIYKFSR